MRKGDRKEGKNHRKGKRESLEYLCLDYSGIYLLLSTAMVKPWYPRGK